MYLSLEHPSHLTIVREYLLCHPQLTRVTRETPTVAAMNMTPLGLAAFLGKPRTVELLLTAGQPVAVDGRDMERRTALMHAVLIVVTIG
ncbi:hypothetical protein BDF19DRAFT_249794 [Syncephalis fuscata]|nr:hypothetical protein BDF19DRAFT_249794 [Syncephalis fuscata]